MDGTTIGIAIFALVVISIVIVLAVTLNSAGGMGYAAQANAQAEAARADEGEGEEEGDGLTMPDDTVAIPIGPLARIEAIAEEEEEEDEVEDEDEDDGLAALETDHFDSVSQAPRAALAAPAAPSGGSVLSASTNNDAWTSVSRRIVSTDYDDEPAWDGGASQIAPPSVRPPMTVVDASDFAVDDDVNFEELGIFDV